MSHAALEQLIAATSAALSKVGENPAGEDAARVCEELTPAMAALLAAGDGAIPGWACESLDGTAVGNLLHADPDGRFHILAVVFPEGTSSGVHFHGCWGLIGYLRGGDEETRYRAVSEGDDEAQLEEVRRDTWHQGDIVTLLPPVDGWHRVRNPGPGDGVSVHVLCMTPAMHPHRYWDRSTGAVLPYPFIEAAPDRWRAQVVGLDK